MGLSQTMRFILGHPLNRGRPLKTLLRYAHWQLESRLRDEVVFDWAEGAKLVVRRGMRGATGNIYCGLHEFLDMAFLLHLLRPGDLFVDVGANVGSYTVLASAVCGARSLAIEPDPTTIRWLQRNVEINAMNDLVTVVEAAVGAAPGIVCFTVGQDTTNRVVTSTETGTREIRIRTLDEIIGDENPVLIKMDVEGYEPQVIAGAQATLENPSLAAVILETVDPGIDAALASHGFTSATYQPFERSLSSAICSSAPVPRQNTLFVRTNRLGTRLKTAKPRYVAGIFI